MSVENVRTQIERFLKSPNPEVLCIRGHWGTGKTYVWQTAAKALREGKEKVALDQYAYVSLFGVNSISQLRSQILQNTLPRAQIGDLVTSETVKSKLNAAEGTIKRGFLSAIGLAGDGVFDAVVAGLSVMVSKQIICFDDLERKGADLRTGDVLGYVSYLREERKCKVVILLNDEALQKDDLAQFSAYLEKVVDLNLKFEPTATQSADIALSGGDDDGALKALVRERCIKLGIDNVRVIRKIYRLAQEIEPLLEKYKPGVLRSVVSTIVLMAWSHLQPEMAPSKEFLIKRMDVFANYFDKKDGEVSKTEQKWRTMVGDYGYTHTDDFDIALLEGVEDGYFTKEIVEKHAAELHQRVEADEAGTELNNAWRQFHDSFNGDLNDSLERFKDCITVNGKYYSLHNMMSVINMFRDLGKKDDGDKLFDLYLAARIGIEHAYNVNDMPMYGVRIDQDIREKLAELEEHIKPKYPVDELFMMLSDDGYNDNITGSLANLPVEEFLRVLKSHNGHDFDVIRRGLTQYNRLDNPNEAQSTIIRKTGEALKQIAAENEFNKLKASRWGILQKIVSLDDDAQENA